MESARETEGGGVGGGLVWDVVSVEVAVGQLDGVLEMGAVCNEVQRGRACAFGIWDLGFGFGV
jgi:hypothetical protein